MDMQSKSQVGTKWFLDTGNSFVGFAVKHYGINFVKGLFTRFVINLEFDPNAILKTKIQATIDATSINTTNARRDLDLQEPEYLHTERYPEIIFVSSRVEQVSDKKFHLVGDLTIKNVTKEVVLDVTYGGTSEDPKEIHHLGFTAEATINRKDFHLTAHTPLPTGHVMVGDEVKITLDIEIRE